MFQSMLLLPTGCQVHDIYLSYNLVTSYFEIAECIDNFRNMISLAHMKFIY